jgi:hypothetical protein
MKRLVRQLRTLPGAILGITFLLIVTFWVWNFLSSRAPAPVSTAAGWLFQRSTGEAYTGAAPVAATSPYSANANLGPMI